LFYLLNIQKEANDAEVLSILFMVGVFTTSAQALEGKTGKGSKTEAGLESLEVKGPLNRG